MSIAKLTKILSLDHIGEYFENPVQSYNNLDKQSIRLLLGKKYGALLRHVPDHFTPEGIHGYALLRGYNCQAACHYCFLQSYFKSPDMVKFSNTDDYLQFLDVFLCAYRHEYGDNHDLVLYDGDFHDSLGYAHLDFSLQQINKIVALIERYPRVFLELKTKCIYPRDFDRLYGALTTSDRLWMAITYSPQYCIDQYEPGTASLSTRVDFGCRCLDRGYSLGVRIDPTMIPLIRYYDDMIGQLVSTYGHGRIRDRRFGVLRIKDGLYKQLKKNKSGLIDGLIADRGFWSYSLEDKKRLYDCVASHHLQDPVFFCMDSDHA